MQPILHPDNVEMDDRQILETYEPVLRFAHSERFYPMDAGRYLEHCQVFPSGPQGVVGLVAQRAGVREKKIGSLPGGQYYLRFVNNPLMDSDAWVWWAILSALGVAISWVAGHWVGIEIALTASLLAALVIFMLASPIRLRIIPAILGVLVISLLMVLPIWFFLKPRAFIGIKLEYLVLLPLYILILIYLSIQTLKFILERIIPDSPGLIMDMLSQATEQIAGEAYTLYARLLEQDPQPVYYGRVVHEVDRQGGRWTIVQYHFFYAFNDWRLAAHGINHHEGDWEMAAVYLKEGEPTSMLFSQHGAGYMESWDRVRKVIGKDGQPTDHPLVYVALGSHANYSRPEIIRSASLYPRGLVQRFVYWADGMIHFLFMLFNPSQASRQIALKELTSRPGQILNENAFDSLRDETDHYVISLPLEIASGDGFRIGYGGDPLREGMIISSSYLKRVKSDRAVSRPASAEWRSVLLDPGPEWVEYQGLWGVKSLLENESGPPGPKWDRPLKNLPPEVRLRWGQPMTWLNILESEPREVDKEQR